MNSTDTAELLRRFVREGCQQAFTALVERYTPVVYGAARRRTGRHDLAAEITQSVFTELARRAPAMAWDDRLGAWLHRRALFDSSDALKSESRRLARETEASRRMHDSPLSSTGIAPFLDEALDRLPQTDRLALTLRYLEERDLRAVGRALGVSDDAAQKRIARALERLRSVFFRRGLSLTVAALAAALTAEAQARVPAGVVGSVTAGALHARTAGSLWFKAWPHLRAALLGSTGVLAIAAAPLWTQHRQLEQSDSTGAPGPAAEKSAVSSTSVNNVPRSANVPRMEEGLSVEEIVRRVAALTKLRQTGLISERGAALLSSIPKAQTLQALNLLHEAFREGFPNLRWINDNLSLLVSAAAEQNPAAALAWAKEHLSGQRRADCLARALIENLPHSFETIQPWLPLILIRETGALGEGSLAVTLLYYAARPLPFAEAAQSLVRLSAQFDSSAPCKAIGKLIGTLTETPAGKASASAARSVYWHALEQLPAPGQRNDLRADMLSEWAVIDFPAARACVETLPPELVPHFAGTVTFPPQSDSAADWRPHIDWLNRVAPEKVRNSIRALYQHSPEQTLAWMRAHPDLVTPMSQALMPEISCVAMPEDEAARAIKMQEVDALVRPFVQLWKTTDPGALQKYIQSTGTVTVRETLERCAQP